MYISIFSPTFLYIECMDVIYSILYKKNITYNNREYQSYRLVKKKVK